MLGLAVLLVAALPLVGFVSLLLPGSG